jgi:C4-dicarboxylate transporter DctM subunit
MERYRIVSVKLNNFSGAMAGTSILILAIIVTYEVVMRYIFKSPSIWTSEVSVLLCVGSAFLPLGFAMKEKAHIDVDLITQRLSHRNQILFSLMGLILSTIFSVVLTWKGTEVVVNTFQAGELVPSGIAIPMFIPRAFIPIGGALLTLELVYQILVKFSELKGFKEESELKSGTWIAKYSPPLIFVALVGVSVIMCFSTVFAPLGLFILLFALIFSGMSIAMAMGLLGLIGFQCTFGGGPMLIHVPMVSFSVLSDFILVAIPLFIMVSTVLAIGGIGSDLFELANKFVGHLPGGMAMATIVACAVFAAISGSSAATALTIGMIAIPEMLSNGYKRQIAYGTVAIGGVLGPLIPPSIFMIVIGAITGESIGKLFMAGMLPGIMLASLFCIYIFLYSLGRRDSMPKAARVPWKDRLESFQKSSLGLLTPVIILGGIYSGIFTPTEAAGVAVIYGLLICAILYRTLSLKKLWRIILDGAKLTSVILFLVTGAMVFGQVVALLRVPDVVIGFFSSLPLSPLVILLIVLIFILFLGALMDEGSILLITYPILYQVFVKHFGFDHIWFALVFVFTLEVGLVAPPVGLNLFVVQGIDKSAKFEEVVRGVSPFILIMIGSILIVVFFKPLSTWLPRLIG